MIGFNIKYEQPKIVFPTQKQFLHKRKRKRDKKTMVEIIHNHIKFTTPHFLLDFNIHKNNYKNLILIKYKLVIKLGFQILETQPWFN